MGSQKYTADGFGPQFLMIPGPSPVADRVRAAMGRASIDFSSNEFVETSDRLFALLKPIFCSAEHVFLYGANGHGAWEAALSNCIKAGDEILLPETGLFSEAWRGMASRLGAKVRTIPSDWRRGVDADAVEKVLRDDTSGAIKAVLVVHTDTATGVTSDVGRIRDAMDRVGHDALYMVDTIASLCTTEFLMTDWRVDVAIAASQKALGAPPGLSMCGVSQKALDLAVAADLPSYYWSWTERMKTEHYKRFCGTAPEQLVFALTEAITMLNEHGLDQTIRRHTHLAEMVQAAVGVWCEGGALEFSAVNPDERATSVTTIRTPEGFDAEMLRDHLRTRYNVIVGGGLGQLRGSIFRIGHMGHINAPYVLGALGAIDSALKSLKVPVGDDAVAAAAGVMIAHDHTLA